MEIKATSYGQWRAISFTVRKNKNVALVFRGSFVQLIANELDRFIKEGWVDMAVVENLNWLQKLRFSSLVPKTSSSIDTLKPSGYEIASTESDENEIRLLLRPASNRRPE